MEAEVSYPGQQEPAGACAPLLLDTVNGGWKPLGAWKDSQDVMGCQDWSGMIPPITSPSGQYIAWVNSYTDSNGYWGEGVFLYDFAIDSITNLTPIELEGRGGTRVSALVWSEIESLFFATATLSEGYYADQIYRFQTTDGTWMPLSNESYRFDPGYKGRLAYESWSAIGMVAFLAPDEFSSYDIHISVLGGGGEWNLTKSPGNDTDPVWRPFGYRSPVQPTDPPTAAPTEPPPPSAEPTNTLDYYRVRNVKVLLPPDDGWTSSVSLGNVFRGAWFSPFMEDIEWRGTLPGETIQVDPGKMLLNSTKLKVGVVIWSDNVNDRLILILDENTWIQFGFYPEIRLLEGKVWVASSPEWIIPWSMLVEDIHILWHSVGSIALDEQSGDITIRKLEGNVTVAFADSSTYVIQDGEEALVRQNQLAQTQSFDTATEAQVWREINGSVELPFFQQAAQGNLWTRLPGKGFPLLAGFGLLVLGIVLVVLFARRKSKKR